MKARNGRKDGRKGLTLIELVMVLIILAALAALVVPIVDSLRRTSDKTTGAATIQQVVENISLFRTMTGDYPDNFDSLTDGAGDEFAQLPGDLKDKLDPRALEPEELEGLNKVGIDEVLDHDVSTAYRGQPGNSGTVSRPFDNASSGGGATFLVVNNVAGKGLDIARSIYPGATPAADGTITLDDGIEVRLVVLGVGPNNESIGQTMVSAPAYQGVDGLTEYNRYLAVFAVYRGTTATKRAQLKAALDSKGDFLNQELAEIAENNLE